MMKHTQSRKLVGAWLCLNICVRTYVRLIMRGQEGGPAAKTWTPAIAILRLCERERGRLEKEGR